MCNAILDTCALSYLVRLDATILTLAFTIILPLCVEQRRKALSSLRVYVGSLEPLLFINEPRHVISNNVAL